MGAGLGPDGLPCFDEPLVEAADAAAALDAEGAADEERVKVGAEMSALSVDGRDLPPFDMVCFERSL